MKLTADKNIKGFTLIEMMTALAIFVVIMLIATNIYVVINNSQRRVVTMQKVMDDTRYLTEAIAQDIRLGRINYDFYSNATNNSVSAIDLHPEAVATVKVLAVVNQLNETVFYNFLDDDSNRVQYCKQEQATDCDLTEIASGWQDVTPEDVEITDMQFIISPSADPFTEVAGLPCPSGDVDCQTDSYISYRCDTNIFQCAYYSDGNNFQPKVQLVVKAQGRDKKTVEQSRVHFQTVISTRPAKGKVSNTFYE